MVAYVMRRDHVDFKTAAISLGAWDDSPRTADARRETAARQRERERIDRVTAFLATAEHERWRDCRDRIHECDQVLAAPGPWSETQWQRAWAAFVLRDEYLLSEYTLLSFGAIPERTHYILADDWVRAKMAAAIRWAGGVRAEDGRWQEVVA